VLDARLGLRQHPVRLLDRRPQERGDLFWGLRGSGLRERIAALSTQKAFALPPGLAFGSASPRMLERAKTLPGRGIYFDLVPYDTEIRKRQTPYTPALSLLYALDVQLTRIAASGGIEARWARHQAMQQRVERWVAEKGPDLGIAFLPKAGRRSWTPAAAGRS